MRSSHNLDRLDVAFDDERLVADAGLLLPATLAQHLSLHELVERQSRPGSRGLGGLVERGASPRCLRRRPTGRVRGGLPSAPTGDHRGRLKPNHLGLHETQGGSVGELLDGKAIDYQHVTGANVTHRRAQRARVAEPERMELFARLPRNPRPTIPTIQTDALLNRGSRCHGEANVV